MHLLHFNKYIKVGRVLLSRTSIVQLPQVIQRMRQYLYMPAPCHPAVVWVCAGHAKGTVLETFVHQRMRRYSPHELINSGSDNAAIRKDASSTRPHRWTSCCRRSTKPPT